MAPSNKRKRQSQSTSRDQTHRSTDHEQTTESSATPAADIDTSPFVVEWVKEGTKSAKRAKLSKGKAQDISEEKEEEGIPGAHLGGRYTVKPGTHWNNLRKYRNFVVNPNNEPKDNDKHKFELGQYVFVNHAENIEAMIQDDKDSWVAQVKEVRAEGQHAVYVRVLWLYWPEELPHGREVYHGEQELIASNFHQIIDAMTVSGKAQVRHLEDVHDVSGIPVDALYWRQTLDVRKPLKSRVSTLPKECICKSVSNPDGVVVRCPNEKCQKWQHRECLLDAVLTKYWEERGPKLGPSSTTGDMGNRTETGNDDGDEEEGDIGDTIVASPKNGFIGLATNISRNMFKRLTGGVSEKAHGRRANGTTAKKTLKKSRKKSRRSASMIDKDKPWEDILAADLQIIKNEEGLSEFDGKATISRVARTENSEQELEEFDEIEAVCLFCGLSMVKGDEDVESEEHDPNLDPDLFAPNKSNGHTISNKTSSKKMDYDAVREAAAENAASSDELSAASKGTTYGEGVKNDPEAY